MSNTATIATQLAPALSAYAQRLHRSVADDHHIVSPLGAWMLLALCARGSDGRLREELTRVLGMDVDLAATAVASLLEQPHPAVRTGAGIWTSPQIHAEHLAQWLARLPVAVDRGAIPSKTALDDWTAKRTLGMSRELPVQPLAKTLLLLATTVASKVVWVRPFRSVPARELGGSRPSEWSRLIERALRTPVDRTHIQFIARTERAGDVCVQTVLARESLVVTSVIAERGVSPPDVIAAAYDLAVAVACQRPITARSLFELPLGDSPMWTIREEEIVAHRRGDRHEICTALLPAWSGEATHDLGHPDLGFPAAAAWLAQLTRSEDLYGYQAKQSVVARFNRTGFEAAAVSAMGLVGSALPRERGLLRRATLRFAHPFAVVAVTRGWTDWIGDRSGRTRASELWNGLPVYSAWITVPTEAEKEPAERTVDVDMEPLLQEWPRYIVIPSPTTPIEKVRDSASRTLWSTALD